MPTWLIVVLGLIAVAAFFYIQYTLRQKKIAALRKFAGERGLNFVERDDNWAHQFSGHPFGEGFARRAEYVVHGRFRDREIVAFEYIFKTERGSGDDRETETHHYMVVSIGLPAARPMLQVSRENVGWKLLGSVGFKDLQLESEEFNKRFRIKTDNNKFAYDVLHPRTMQWMMDDHRFTAQPFRFERANILTWHQSTMQVDMIDDYLNFLCDIVDSVPSFVWR